MEMYDVKTIEMNGRILFQTAKMVSPQRLKNSLQDVACFFYVLKGRGRLVESNGSHNLEKHDGLLKSCGNFVSDYTKDGEGNDFEAIAIYFHKDMIGEIYQDIVPDGLDLSSFSKPPQKIVSDELIEKYIKNLQLYFENDELLDDNLSKLKIKELVMILLKSNYFESVIDLFQSLFSPASRTFRQVIENNLFSDVTLDQLAFLTHRSLSTFKREFKKEFNESPARYIKGRRLEKAAKLLRFSDNPISDIAYSCGFQDLSTFSSVFRDRFKVSPSEYRLNQMGKSLN